MNVEHRTLNCVSPNTTKGQEPGSISSPCNNPPDERLLSGGSPSPTLNVAPASRVQAHRTLNLLVEECAKCGGHTIVDDFEYTPGLGREKYRKCHTCGSRNIKTVEKPQNVNRKPETVHWNHRPRLAMPDTVNCSGGDTMKQEKEESRMALHAKCSECKTRIVVLHGKCSQCFKTLHGITVNDFKRRLKAGETQEEILAAPGGAMPKQLKKAFNDYKEFFPDIDPRKNPVKSETKPAEAAPPTAAMPKADDLVTINLNSSPISRAQLAEIAAETARGMSPSDQIIFLIGRAGFTVHNSRFTIPGI